MAAAPFGSVSAQLEAAPTIKCISATNPLDTGTSYFPPTMRITADGSEPGAAEVTVAGGFSVHYYNHFKVAKTICGKHQPFTCQPKTYVLTLCGAGKPSAYDNGTALPDDAIHFSVPLTAVATASGGPVPFLEMLDLLHKVEVVDPSTMHSPCLQKVEEELNVTGAGAGGVHKANWTKLIEEHPRVTAVFTDSWGTGASGSDKDVVFDGSADSSGVLGRAEWIKFMSLFFNDEDKANLYFAREQKAYKAMEDNITAVKSTRPDRTCAWVQKSWTGKYELSFTTYKTDLCRSVGLVPRVNATLVAEGTYKQVFDTTAEFHDMLHQIDVVIDESYFYTPSTADKAAVLAGLNITGLNKSGAMLLRTDGHVSDTVSSFYADNPGTVFENLAWLESAVVRPALVLEDLAAKVWRDAVSPPPAGCAQYFRDVVAGEMPVVVGKDACDAFEAAEKEGKCITNAVAAADVDRSKLVPPPPPSPPMPPPVATAGASVATSTAVVSTLLAIIATLVM